MVVTMTFERMSAAQYRHLLSIGAFDGGASASNGGKPGQASGSIKAVGTVGVERAPRKRRAAVEEDLQISCFQWIFAHEHRYPCLKTTFHTPNGGRRSKGEAGRFKAMGVRKGVVDILNPFPSGFAPGFACELKAPNEDLTSEQISFLAVANENGYVNGVCYSFDEFLTLIHRYLGIA